MKTTKLLIGIAITTAVLLYAPRADAKILIDLGNNSSYRGASTGNPDVNGNYWNSVWSGAYYSNLLNTDGTASTISFGFSSVKGTDSYNGPAGATTGSGDVANVVIDAAALGDFGVKPAVFDYYNGDATTRATFTIQNLDPAKSYILTFFGSHKYNANNTTVYTVYTSNDYATAVASASLLVGVGALHNSNTVVAISNLVPQFANSLWVGFQGSAGGDGYLNALKIDIIPEPTAVAGLGAALLLIARKRRQQA